MKFDLVIFLLCQLTLFVKCRVVLQLEIHFTQTLFQQQKKIIVFHSL